MSGDARGVAIVGMACRFPGADTPGQFWRNLRDGVESITFFSDEELLAAGVAPELLAHPGYVKASPTLAGFDRFDARFFALSPREATLMDPQHRLFLEVSWAAMEDAGYTPDASGRSVGVFAGSGGLVTSYMMAHRAHPDLPGETAGLQHITNDKDFLSTRVSFKLNLTGPSVTVQTACSTSLVAVHLGCQSLLSMESDMVLAGASTIRVPHISGYLVEPGSVHSADGHCRSFDAGGRGTIFGSGVAAVLLKRVDDALADGDRIYAVIRGSAINNDGAQKVSYTAPSVMAQARAMLEALEVAEVGADSIGYVECHATGTPVGDPLEIQALTRAFRTQTDRRGYCAVGSVKTNIGHSEQTAGLAGLIKTALALSYREIPPTLHYETPNPAIPFEESPFYVASSLARWESGSPRRAGVNSLGIGGTNAFVVLEEAPAAPRRQDAGPRPCHLLCLSAKTESALRSWAASFSEDLARHPDRPLVDVCATANRSRTGFDHRLSLVAADAEELRRQLDRVAAGGGAPIAGPTDPAPGVVFLFSGQGAQYPGMAHELYRSQPVFRRAMDRCDAILADTLEPGLLELLDPAAEEPDRIHQTRFTQPLLFAVEYALAALWESWGVHPAAVHGHSLGELTAACVAGVLELPEALRFVAERADEMQRLPGDGAMAAVFAPAEPVAEAVAAVVAEHGPRLAVAVYNSPENTVLSGERAALEIALEALAAEGLAAKQLTVSHAFHSPLMEPALDSVLAAAKKLAARRPRIPLISNVTGEVMTEAPEPGYWCRHVREPVRFAEGMATLAAMEHSLFLEIGPGSSLQILGRQCLPDPSCEWLPSLAAGSQEWRTLLGSLGRLYQRGVEVSWDAVEAGSSRRTVSLPTYPFEGKRYWLDAPRPAATPPAVAVEPPLLITEAAGAPAGERRFELQLSRRRLPYLEDHQVYSLPVVPTALLLELALEAGHRHLRGGGCEVSGFLYHDALVLAEAGAAVRLTLDDTDGGPMAFRISSRAEGAAAWRRHAAGALTRATGEPPAGAVSLDAVRSRCRERLAGEAYYATARTLGLDYGPSFQGVDEIWRGDDELVARVEIEPSRAAEAAGLHPTLLDACLHTYPLLTGDAPGEATHLPISVERLAVHRPRAAAAWVHARLRSAGPSPAGRVVDVALYDDRSRRIAELTGLTLRRLPAEAFAGDGVGEGDLDGWLYRLEWRESADARAAGGAGGDPKSLLVFADEGGTGAALAERAREAGHAVCCVRRGAAFGETDPGDWQIRAAERADFERLIAELAQRGTLPDTVFHLWALDAAGEAGAADVDAAVELGTRSALYALQVTGGAPGARLWLVTRGAQSVGGSQDRVEPFQAPLWGLGRTAALEHPLSWGGLVDLDPASLDAGADAGALLDEVTSGDGENQVARRGGRRCLARLARRGEAAARAEPVRYRSDSTYLITGGLGMLGLEISRWLVHDKGVRFLALVGRTPPGADAASAIEKLRAAGARVEVIQADVADRAQVTRALRVVEQSMPRLAGVFHGAGMIADGILQRLDWGRFARVLAAKVRGAWHLHAATASSELDLFVVHSSMLSLTGSAGQANYTAANAFLDALVDYRLALGLPATGLNWGPWAESGMAAASGERGAAGWRSRGIAYLPRARGIEALDVVLAAGADHAAVFIADWSKRLGHTDEPPIYSEISAGETAAAPRPPSAAPPEPEPVLPVGSAPGAGTVGPLLAILSREAGQVLGFEEGIDTDLALNQLGLDSLMAVQLANRLQVRLGTQVPLALLIRGPSLEELARELAPAAEPAAEVAEPARAVPITPPRPPRPSAAASRTVGDGWLLLPRPDEGARCRLFCFPFSGGSAATYRPWAEALDPSIELVCIEPPGRATRVDEPPIRSMGEFVDRLVPVMEPLLDKPFAVFGYCLGAMTLWETVRRLRAEARALPAHILVSGARAPHRAAHTGPFEEQLLSGLVKQEAFDPFLPLYEQPDEVFGAVLRQFNIGATEDFLAETDLRQMLLPSIRADFEMAHRHRFRREPPWQVPITCFVAADDPYVSRDDAIAWSEYTTTEFRIHFRVGTHFLIDEDQGFLVSAINSVLAGTAPLPGRGAARGSPVVTHQGGRDGDP